MSSKILQLIAYLEFKIKSLDRSDQVMVETFSIPKRLFRSLLIDKHECKYF